MIKLYAPLGTFPKSTQELEQENGELRAQLAECQREAVNLATSLWREHFRQESPEWTPLNTVPGVISQISNMVTVIRDYKAERDAALERVALQEEVARKNVVLANATYERCKRLEGAVDLLDALLSRVAYSSKCDHVYLASMTWIEVNRIRAKARATLADNEGGE